MTSPYRDSSPQVNDPRADRIAFTPAEAAEILGVTRQTVYNLIGRGDIRKFKIGTCTRIPAADVYGLVGYDPTAGAA